MQIRRVPWERETVYLFPRCPVAANITVVIRPHVHCPQRTSMRAVGPVDSGKFADSTDLQT